MEGAYAECLHAKCEAATMTVGGVTVARTSQTSTLELLKDSPACPAWLGPWEKMPRGTVLITVTYGKGLVASDSFIPATRMMPAGIAALHVAGGQSGFAG